MNPSSNPHPLSRSIHLDRQTIDNLRQAAVASPQKRARLCLHTSDTDPVHEMIIALHPDSYCPPHRHLKIPFKSYHLIEGSLGLLFFDDSGTITHSSLLSSENPPTPLFHRFPATGWHMAVALASTAVYCETLPGPFIKHQTVMTAEWAPLESQSSETATFLQQMKSVFS